MLCETLTISYEGLECLWLCYLQSLGTNLLPIPRASVLSSLMRGQDSLRTKFFLKAKASPRKLSILAPALLASPGCLASVLPQPPGKLGRVTVWAIA